MASTSTYQLVRSEVSHLLRGISERERRQLLDEIAFRIDSGDESIDVAFMSEALGYLSGTKGTHVSSFVNRSSPTNVALTALMSKADELLLQEEMKKGLEEGEELFMSQGRDFVKPERSRYNQNPSIVARMPKFFNKVRYGVVWNRYAQTHYDEQNPPPRQVVGYKFNILYPELLDKSVAPKYKLESSDSPETLLLRFFAGAPYEDLVFKIVNKEWDLDRRSGFTCQFERGVLQLYFVFRKDTYRR